MSIKLKLHSVNPISKDAVVSLYDGDVVIFENSNISIDVNGDGSANTSWLTHYAKHTIYMHRIKMLEDLEGDII